MKNTIAKSLLVLAAGSLISVGAAVAQDGQNRDLDPGHPRVNQVDNRQVNQQDRIANGVKSGQLTAGEAGRLERNEAAIQRQKRADMRANGGHLTKQEQNHLNREQTRESHAIYRDKHNNVKR